jgi:hypothetical protein
MKFAKMLGVAAVAAMALMAFASTASATTLEVGGVAQNRAVTIHATLAAGTSALLTDTFRVLANTCTESTMHGETETPFTTAGTTGIRGGIRALSWGSVATPCTEGNPTVHRAGTLSVQATNPDSTNGTVFSTGAEVTVPSPFGLLNCTTNGTDIGLLTGVRVGRATMDIRATLTCTRIGDGLWTGTYTVTSPEGLGVVT